MRKLYLEEDNDILDQLEKHAGTSVDEKALISKLQIKAVLRNRKSLEDSSKETKGLTLVLMVIGFVQLIIAFCQLALSNLILKYNIVSGILSLVIAGVMYWLFRIITKK